MTRLETVCTKISLFVFFRPFSPYDPEQPKHDVCKIKKLKSCITNLSFFPPC